MFAINDIGPAHSLRFASDMSHVAMFSWSTNSRMAERVENPAETHKLVIEHYGDAMDALARHMPEAPKDLFEELKRETRAIRANLQPLAPGGILDDLGSRFTTVVEEFAKRVNGYLRRQDQETRDILQLVSSMTDTLGRQDNEYSLRFQNITKRLKALSGSSDLAQIKWQLTAEVEQLEKSMADMNRDTAGSILRLRQGITQFEPKKVTALPVPLAAVSSADVLKTRGRCCIGFFLLEPVTESALSFLYSRCLPGDALEKTRQCEYIIVKDCSLLDMADEVSKVRKELERMGITCKAGAAEMMRGESKDVVVGRARASAGATLSAK